MRCARFPSMKKKVIILSIGLGLIINVILPSCEIIVGFDGVYAEVVGEDDVGDDVFGDDTGSGDETIDDEGGDDDDDDKLPRLYIKAVNPGYKIDGVNNVGEMIEIAHTGDPDTPISLAGIAVSYTNSSGNTALLLEFPEHSFLTGESILLKLASSPGAELANVTYMKTLAMNASLTLTMNAEVIDEVCWTGKSDCYKAFSSSKPTTLLRNLETGEFDHTLIYEPVFKSDNYYVEEVEEEKNEVTTEVVTPQCRGMQFSEILSYYESSKSEQFIEFYNSGAGVVNLDGCKVRYKNKKYVLSGVVEPEGYFVYYPTAFTLTKNPVSSNKIEIIDIDETVVDVLEYPNGQRKGTAYALIGYNESGGEIWKMTYAPTPGTPNNYQDFKTCESGKVLNEVTGNCVKVTSMSEKVCKDGYYLNILTGRCKKITVNAEKTCREGYYLNPETGRCKKIKENKGADYSLEPESYEENSSFVALYAVLGVLGVGVVYLIWEFREEIKKIWLKLLKKKN